MILLDYYVKVQFVIIFCYKSITGYTEVTRYITLLQGKVILLQ